MWLIIRNLGLRLEPCLRLALRLGPWLRLRLVLGLGLRLGLRLHLRLGLRLRNVWTESRLLCGRCVLCRLRAGHRLVRLLRCLWLRRYMRHLRPLRPLSLGDGSARRTVLFLVTHMEVLLVVPVPSSLPLATCSRSRASVTVTRLLGGDGRRTGAIALPFLAYSLFFMMENAKRGISEKAQSRS